MDQKDIGVVIFILRPLSMIMPMTTGCKKCGINGGDEAKNCVLQNLGYNYKKWMTLAPRNKMGKFGYAKIDWGFGDIAPGFQFLWICPDPQLFHPWALISQYTHICGITSVRWKKDVPFTTCVNCTLTIQAAPIRWWRHISSNGRHFTLVHLSYYFTPSFEIITYISSWSRFSPRVLLFERMAGDEHSHDRYIFFPISQFSGIYIPDGNQPIFVFVGYFVTIRFKRVVW